MKKKITDKKRINKFLKEMRALCKKHNIYPMADLILGEGMEYSFYELDKMTKKERAGQVKPTGKFKDYQLS